MFQFIFLQPLKFISFAFNVLYMYLAGVGLRLENENGFAGLAADSRAPYAQIKA